MQLTPRYGSAPLIALDGDPAAIAGPLARQRTRLTEALRALSDEQWAQPSRCDGWSVRDVIVHLDGTNSFWGFSLTSGLKGRPSRLLASFDPVASPAELVAASDQGPDEVLASFAASTERLVALASGLDAEAWTTLAEAPPGHLSASAVAHHALWDSWVHERDVLLPLGIDPVVEVDEVEASLRYAAALAPALAVTRDPGRRGRLAVAADDTAIAFTVEVDGGVTVRRGVEDDAEVVLGGPAVDLLEALSIRRPLDRVVAPEARWMVEGLAEAFDQT